MNILFAAVAPALVNGISSYSTQRKFNRIVNDMQADSRRQAANAQRNNDLSVALTAGHTSIFPTECTGIRHLELMITETLN